MPWTFDSEYNNSYRLVPTKKCFSPDPWKLVDTKEEGIGNATSHDLVGQCRARNSWCPQKTKHDPGRLWTHKAPPSALIKDCRSLFLFFSLFSTFPPSHLAPSLFLSAALLDFSHYGSGTYSFYHVRQFRGAWGKHSEPSSVLWYHPPR